MFGDIGEKILSRPENIAVAIAALLFLISVAIWGF